MSNTFTVQMDEDQFRICGPDGEEGELVSYDGVATLVIGDDVYLCRVDDPDAPTQRVECVTQTKLMPTAIEDTEFQEEDEDDDGPDPDGGEEIEVDDEEEPAA